jgi:two-component system nitrogen regulation sensor histidine kinase NtrY
VNAVVREAALAVVPEPDLELALDPGAAELVTDPDRLRAALVNLLQNAREAAADAPSAGAPGVRVSTRVSNSRFVIEVADRGAGIRPEHHPHLFDPYFTTKRSGTGLGLAIAKNVVDALRGTIALEPREGGGTLVSIELPREPPEAR